MILSNEFTVGAEVDTVWRHLLDIEGVARCLPGATLEVAEEEGSYNGSMRVRMGPMTVDYKGTARFAEIDEENRTATIALSARAKKGQGTAMATIKNRLEPSDGGTRVLAETDLQITGPQAQFGRGVMEDVGGRVLAEFSRRLEREIAGTESAPEGSRASVDSGADAAARATSDVDAGAHGRPSSGRSNPADEDDALDLGAVLFHSRIMSYARIAVAAVVVLVALRMVLGRR